MNWVQRKIYLYNVTFGLYMLDWWERYLFRFFGGSLDVVRYIQWYTILFGALPEAFSMKTGLVSCTIKHEKLEPRKPCAVGFNF